jgi:hypothetical protein
MSSRGPFSAGQRLVACSLSQAASMKMCRIVRMFEEHPNLTPPVDPDVALWRYMDLARFMSLLESRALFFARADIMVDKCEGSMTTANVTRRPSQLGENMVTQMANPFRLVRKVTYLSCWHVSNVESAAMWGLYQADGRGVAVRTTWRRLTKSLEEASQVIFGGIVKYVDYDTAIIPEESALVPYCFKRQSFEHEHEARLLLWMLEDRNRESDNEDVELFSEKPPGFYIPVNLTELVTNVYVAPEAQDWFAELVGQIARRYGHGWPVQHSDLLRDPLF